MAEMPVWLTSNYNCNLQCKWCFQREMARSGKVMDCRLAKKLIDLCAELPVKHVILIGGEPTLYPNFFDVVRHVKSRGLSANVISNSVRFADSGFLAESQESGVKAVTTSVKGSSSEEYLVATGCDAFDLVCRAILNLENSGIAHHVSVTISSSIIDNWSHMIGFIKTCGAKNFHFSFEKPTILPNNTVTLDDRMAPRNIAGFIQNVMYPSLLESGINFKIKFMFPHCFLHDGFVEKLEAENHAFSCCILMNRDGIVFDPDGIVLPCNHLVTYPLGKYGEDFTTSEEFLRWKCLEKTSNFYRSVKLAPSRKCAECDRWPRCGGGCRIFWLCQGQGELSQISTEKNKPSTATELLLQEYFKNGVRPMEASAEFKGAGISPYASKSS